MTFIGSIRGVAVAELLINVVILEERAIAHRRAEPEILRIIELPDDPAGLAVGQLGGVGFGRGNLADPFADARLYEDNALLGIARNTPRGIAGVLEAFGSGCRR